VSTWEATRCVLAWLQLFALALAVVAGHIPTAWVEWACGKMWLAGLGEIGVCACSTATLEGVCWAEQFVLRATAAATILFATLLIMAVSGCAAGAARSHEVGKFMAILVLWCASVLLPNVMFNTFKEIATIIGVLFLIVQSVLVIDLAYTWNEKWYGLAVQANRDLRPDAQKAWTGLILATSAVLVLAAGILAVHLWLVASSSDEHVVIPVVGAISLLLLAFSVTDWCEHGSLLTSAAMLLYTIWMLFEALWIGQPGADSSSSSAIVPDWSRLLLCVASIFALALGVLDKDGEGEIPETLQQGLIAYGSTGADPAGSAQGMSQVERRNFVVQCAAHATIPAYLCTVLLPFGHGSYLANVAAVFACLALYGWSLVAPKVLAGRQF